ncbi:hypothetical protein ElyMa_006325800 [Elysia marginata]|uniref:Secreted protein n=1 Tax=Elysia marginata TaxID=1093978 RepID=A0AAV4HLB0_9GAST|nr:hypothetical protein ElyMa_006325800 [Elysia marginata]
MAGKLELRFDTFLCITLALVLYTLNLDIRPINTIPVICHSTTVSYRLLPSERASGVLLLLEENPCGHQLQTIQSPTQTAAQETEPTQQPTRQRR